MTNNIICLYFISRIHKLVMFSEIPVFSSVFMYSLLINALTFQASVSELQLGPELSRPVVHTPVGSYRGLQAQDGNYSMFLGIPYARVDPDNVFGKSNTETFKVDSSAVATSIPAQTAIFGDKH
ncbi:uncharacterized protein LOC133517370 isoform X2 [Cydia pomonella]|uniref:uncharacterized protein LOC133517370 isoform X2 n=1 Tax=Cydia pomonella TaxID=82600 RepID=UPI002ADD7710|nr:uncharacterized protein LOC133517370 isoform X2 [Cydia pomonella]